MSVTLALLLAAPLFNCGGPVLTFQDMLDSAQLVVIGRVDTIWYTVDTAFGVPNVRNGMRISVRTNVSAEIITAYVKDTCFASSTNSILITHGGGKIGPDSWIEYIPSVSFKEGEIFLAAVEKHPLLSSVEDIYRVSRVDWKYTIANDSLYVGYAKAVPLGQALQALSEAFTEVRR